MKIYAAIKIGEGKEEKGRVCDDRILVNGEILADGYFEAEMKEDMWVVAVSDGVGGSACGWKAATVALETISEWDCEAINDLEIARNYFPLVDEAVRQVSSSSHVFQGTKATLSALVKNKDKIYLLHVGDSRVYQVTCSQGYFFIDPLTEDHNALRKWRLKEKAKGNDYTDEELKASYGYSTWNHITSYVGMASRETFEKNMDVKSGFLSEGMYVLTSDGIHDFLSQTELRWELEEKGEWKDKLENIMRIARKNGSRDDQSIIVVVFDERI